MKIKLNKEEFLSHLIVASKFTSLRITSLPILQGVCLKLEKNKLHFFSSNLNSFFHSFLKTGGDKDEEITVEPKKIIEFVSLLPGGKIDIQTKEKQLIITTGKTSGKFPLMSGEEFPKPPKTEEKEQQLKTGFLVKNLPLVLFAASTDDSRPVLSGINFQTNDELVMVATDGFRLSLIKTKKETEIPSAIIPAEFLKELLSYLKEEKEVEFSYSEKEKIIKFKLGDREFFSRLIEGDFPPFEKVIPQDKKTTVKLEKEEFLRNTKLISVFARDFSNIIVLEIKKGGVTIRPKSDDAKENSTFQEAEVEGDEQTVAFNYKFLLDYLNNTGTKKIEIDILRPDAPVAFRTEEEKNFLHIIMPVRIQE